MTPPSCTLPGMLVSEADACRYGMGLVYLKTGKPKYAEHHFRRAAEINPTNAVLLTCIGMASLFD